MASSSTTQTLPPITTAGTSTISPVLPAAASVRRSPISPSADPEAIPSYALGSDPFSLISSLKTPEEISTLTARHKHHGNGGGGGGSSWRSGGGGRLLGRRPVAAETSGADVTRAGRGKERKVDVKGLRGFYESQNESIQRLLKSVEEHRREAKDEKGDTRLKYQIAVRGSFAANIVLAILQVYGAASSGSLSLFTTMADAIFDPLSNLLLILSHRAVNKVDASVFPSGKARLETAGNILFSFLMCSVSLILIVLSTIELATHDPNSPSTKGFHLPSIIAVAIAFATKLVLLLYCWAIKHIYSQVEILWQDHRNDLLINGFGILTAVGGAKLRWWIDPAGAIVLSLLILGLWGTTAYAEFQLLIGVTAGNDMLQLITYISMTHSPLILQIDTVRAYHSGPRIIVEVDVVMAPSETLRDTHDVAEELQCKIESLPGVERAYVHVDYETSHKPEHFLKKEL